MIQCSACGGATKEKAITTKFGPTTVGECVNGCKNDKGYPLGTFAPRKRQNVPQGAVQPAPQIGVAADMLRELQEIKAILLKIAFKKPENKTIQANEEVDDIDEQILDNDQDGTPF
jgi:hypothetical protein